MFRRLNRTFFGLPLVTSCRDLQLFLISPYLPTEERAILVTKIDTIPHSNDRLRLK
jgi:hypothetical protein